MDLGSRRLARLEAPAGATQSRKGQEPWRGAEAASAAGALTQSGEKRVVILWREVPKELSVLGPKQQKPLLIGSEPSRAPASQSRMAQTAVNGLGFGDGEEKKEERPARARTALERCFP